MKKWFDAKAFSGVDRDAKGCFANVFAHLILAHYPREKIPGWFLNRISKMFGMSCDIEKFYNGYFSSPERKIAFINLCWDYIPTGDWADVQRTLRAWLSEEKIIQKLQAIITNTAV